MMVPVLMVPAVLLGQVRLVMSWPMVTA